MIRKTLTLQHPLNETRACPHAHAYLVYVIGRTSSDTQIQPPSRAHPAMAHTERQTISFEDARRYKQPQATPVTRSKAAYGAEPDFTAGVALRDEDGDDEKSFAASSHEQRDDLEPVSPSYHSDGKYAPENDDMDMEEQPESPPYDPNAVPVSPRHPDDEPFS